MTQREKLIELLSKKIYPRVGADPAEVVADYLIANGVTVQEWISVEERLPENNRPVLIKMRGAIPCTGAYAHFKQEWFFIGMRGVQPCRTNVTHWMPLPEPPKEEADD